MIPAGDANRRGLSRADVECWCVLSAIADGCSLSDLLARLGLSPLLVGVMRQVVSGLEQDGLVEVVQERISSTDRARAWLRAFSMHSAFG